VVKVCVGFCRLLVLLKPLGMSPKFHSQVSGAPPVERSAKATVWKLTVKSKSATGGPLRSPRQEVSSGL